MRPTVLISLAILLVAFNIDGSRSDGNETEAIVPKIDLDYAKSLGLSVDRIIKTLKILKRRKVNKFGASNSTISWNDLPVSWKQSIPTSWEKKIDHFIKRLNYKIPLCPSKLEHKLSIVEEKLNSTTPVGCI